MADDQEKPDSKKTEKKRRPRETMSKKVHRFFVVNDIRTNAEMIKQLFGNVLGDDKPRHNETFDEAVTRLNLGGIDLQLAYKRNRIICLSNLIIAGLIVFYLLFNIFTASGFFEVFYTIAGIGPVMLFLSISFRASFRCWQIRTSQLGGFNTFKSNYRLWWPVHYGPNIRESRKLANRPRRSNS